MPPAKTMTAHADGARFTAGEVVHLPRAVGGEAGVRHAITLLWEEIHRNMAMLGINTVKEMTRDFLMPATGAGFLQQ